MIDNSRCNDDSQVVANQKPSTSLEEDAFVAIVRTADQLQHSAAEMFKQYGLSPTQYNVLRILRGAGPEGLTCREVGERMLNHDPDITRLLDRLQGRGLIARSRGQKDRRVIRTRITLAGLDLLRGLDSPVEQFQRQLLGHMGERELRSLIRLLELARGMEKRPRAINRERRQKTITPGSAKRDFATN
jgi:DNA-binding MarR family transcriptional regulator